MARHPDDNLLLDDDDDLGGEGVPDFHDGAGDDDSASPRRSVPWRKVMGGLLVLLLGGGLGTGAYFLSSMDMRDLIGYLDVSDPNAPKLAMALPGRGPLMQPPGAPLQAEPVPAEAPAAPAAPAASGPALETPAPAPAPLTRITEEGAAQPAAGPLIAPPVLPAGAGAEPAALPRLPMPRDPGQAPSFEALPARAEVKPLTPAAPLAELQRTTPAAGTLPVVSADGKQSWQVYARPFAGPADKPRVAVIVTDLGLDKAATEAAISRLPGEATLCFSPYAAGLDKWVKKARDAGHEVLLCLPTEPPSYPARDPGPFGLLASLSPDGNLARLEKSLGRMAGFAGVFAAPGPFVRSNQLEPVLAALKERGLLYVGEGAKPGDRTPPFAQPTLVADQEPFREAIDARLAQVSEAARRDGRAIAVVSARPLSLDRVLMWLVSAADHGLAAAPASAIVTQGDKK